MRALLDTNVLASGFVRLFEQFRPLNLPALLILAWSAGQFSLLVSEPLLDELERAWRNRYFRSRLPRQDAETLLQLLRDDATMVEPDPTVRGFAPHASDDLIIGTAVAGRADYLVTGDRAFRRLGTFRGVQLVSPLAFLDVLRAGDTASSDIDTEA
jgi:putative PIN family toxin of toxin-antitoxin system